MRINEVVAKVDPSNPDPMKSAYHKAKDLFDPGTWFGGKDKPVDPNLVQNPFSLAGGRNVVKMVASGDRLLPADVNNLKTITAQVKSGRMKPANNIDKNILVSALEAGLRSQELNAQQQRALLDFQEQFR
jgi:hypothetical protein